VLQKAYITKHPNVFLILNRGGGCSLNELQIATLMAMHQEVGLSTNAHVPLTSIHRHFPKHVRGFAKKALKELVKLGLVSIHPTGGSTTYSLTVEGVNKIRGILGV
jgi:RIO-like serine/threonine protein kinase